MNERTYEVSKNPSGTPAAEVPMFGESDPPTPSLPSLHLKTLLVPVDFSGNSRKAVIYAVRHSTAE